MARQTRRQGQMTENREEEEWQQPKPDSDSDLQEDSNITY